MGASHDRMDRVDRARLVESCGARDDSPSWNPGCARQGDTIREGGTSPRGQKREDVKDAAECTRKKNDVSAPRIRATV